MCDKLWVVLVYLEWNSILLIHLISSNLHASVPDFTQFKHTIETPSGTIMKRSWNKCIKLLFYCQNYTASHMTN